MKTNFKALIAVILAATTLAACKTTTVVYQNGGGGSGSGSNGGGGTYTDPYKHAWYDVYGTQCINNGYPMSGCNFYADGTKITSSEDPYYNNLTLYYDVWTYTDSYGYRRSYTGYAWLSTDGILFDSYGNALNEIDQGSSETADVLSQASTAENQVAKSVGKAFAQKYALAESTGITIAKTLQAWAVLGRDRARNADDVKAFAKRLYGIDADKAVNAINASIQGNQQALLDMNADVAAHWGTTPETSSKILKSWYSDSLTSVGVSQ